MKLTARALSLLAAAAIFGLYSTASRAQSGCGPTGTPSSTSMPQYAGTLTAENLSTAGSSNYLYVATQWGFARASLANPASPSGITQVIIANEPGSGNGGLISLTCDCHQGATAFAAAEAARADGSGGVRFGQQVKLANGGSDGSFPLGARIGAIYLPSGKYIGYVPTEAGLAVIDMSCSSRSRPARRATTAARSARCRSIRGSARS